MRRFEHIVFCVVKETFGRYLRLPVVVNVGFVAHSFWAIQIRFNQCVYPSTTFSRCWRIVLFECYRPLRIKYSAMLWYAIQYNSTQPNIKKYNIMQSNAKQFWIWEIWEDIFPHFPSGSRITALMQRLVVVWAVNVLLWRPNLISLDVLPSICSNGSRR